MYKVKPNNLFLMSAILIGLVFFFSPVLSVSATGLQGVVVQQMRCKGNSPTLSVRSFPGTEFKEIARVSTINGVSVGEFVDGWYQFLGCLLYTSDAADE